MSQIIIALIVILAFVGITLFVRNKSKAVSSTTTSTTAPATPLPLPPPSNNKRWWWIGGSVLGIIVILFLGNSLLDAMNDSGNSQQEIAALTQQLKATNPNLSDAQIETLVQAEKGAVVQKQSSGSADKVLDEGSIDKSAQGFNAWILFPFGLVVLMLYIIFFTKPKALNFGAILILIGTLLFFWFNYSWFVPGLNIINEKLGQPIISSDSSTGGLKSLFSTPEPTEVVFRLESLEGGMLCGLPTGRHTITAEQTPLTIRSKEDGSEQVIESILGGLHGEPIIELPYKKEKSEWSILFKKKPSGSEVLVAEDGCIGVTLNISRKQRVKWYTLSAPVDINITAQ